MGGGKESETRSSTPPWVARVCVYRANTWMHHTFAHERARSISKMHSNPLQNTRNHSEIAIESVNYSRFRWCNSATVFFTINCWAARCECNNTNTKSIRCSLYFEFNVSVNLHLSIVCVCVCTVYCIALDVRNKEGFIRAHTQSYFAQRSMDELVRNNSISIIFKILTTPPNNTHTHARWRCLTSNSTEF